MERRRSRTAATALLVLLLVVSACSEPPRPPQRPEAASIVYRAANPGFVHGTDRGEIDRLAATVVTEVQNYWSQQFPAHFDSPWHPLDGGFFSVDTTTASGNSPPCAGSTKDVEGNAYYCASVDAVAWDRAALLPVLREHYGETAVAVVLAHEIGHAVQQRSGMNIGGAEHMMNPVRTEAMADCYAGSFLRWVARRNSERLRMSGPQLDSALRALIVFRDPIGSGQGGTDSHGTAFERVAAFQDGFRGGPAQCADVAKEGHQLTTPQSPEGTESLDGVLHSPNIPAFFRDLLARRGQRWNPPPVRTSPSAGPCEGGPIAYCTRPPAIVVDHGAAAALHRNIGDQANTTLLASRYATAALDALPGQLSGPERARRSACLTGAYTAALSERSAPSLSPGDLDEAVEAFLEAPSNKLTGYDRIAAFRTGTAGGPSACGM